MIKPFLFAVAALGAMLPATGASAQSMGVEPLFVEVRPNQSAAVRVRNGAVDSVPVEVLVFRRDVDENGVQTRVPADDDFIIFPPQAVVEAKKTQVFRIRPLLETTDMSQSYYVSFKQIPQSLLGLADGAQLQVVFSFDAAVHVVPRKASSAFELVSTRISEMQIEQPTGEFVTNRFGRQEEVIRTLTVPALELEINNVGNKYLYLNETEFSADVTLADGTTDTMVWVNDRVADHVDVTLVEPTESRRFKLPLPQGATPLTASVSLKPRDEL